MTWANQSEMRVRQSDTLETLLTLIKRNRPEQKFQLSPQALRSTNKPWFTNVRQLVCPRFSLLNLIFPRWTCEYATTLNSWFQHPEGGSLTCSYFSFLFILVESSIQYFSFFPFPSFCWFSGASDARLTHLKLCSPVLVMSRLETKCQVHQSNSGKSFRFLYSN